jgi:hypothetical protein
MQLFPKASQLNQNMVLIYPIQYCIMWNPFFFMISNFFLFRRKIWILTDKWKWTVLRKVKAKFKCVLQSSSKKGRVILVSSLFVKFHLCSTVRAALLHYQESIHLGYIILILIALHTEHHQHVSQHTRYHQYN